MALDWNNLQVSILRSGESLWPAGHHLSPLWFRSRLIAYDLWYVFRGVGWLQTPKGKTRLKSGTCVWYVNGEDYEVTQIDSHPLGILFTHFDLRTDRGTQPPAHQLPAQILRPASSELFERVLHHVADTWRLARYRSVDERHAAQRQAMYWLTGLLMEYDACSERTPRRGSGTALRHRTIISAVVQQIISHPHDAAASSIRRLAASHGYSLEHFIRVFRGITGVSPKQYLLDVRFKEAKKLLLHSDHSIGEIADLLGYKSLFSFSKQFRQRVGVSAQQYRQQPRKR